MAGEQIEVTVDEDGNVQVEAKGVVGTGCKALTKAIENSLGAVVKDQPTADMHRQQTQQVKANQ